MDFDFISNFAPMYVKAGILTLKLAFFGIAIAIIIGFACMWIKYKQIPILRKIVDIYVELSRNTPLLIQLFFLYYGLPKVGISLSSFSCAVIGLAFLGGSYMAESFRLGVESIKKAQIESAQSLALSPFQIFIYVILPKTVNIAMPSISANIIFLIKETSIVSVVALSDLVYVAKDIIGLYYKTNEALFLLVISYLIIILPISLILTFIEKRLSYARS